MYFGNKMKKTLMKKPRLRWQYILLLFLLVAVSPMLDLGVSRWFFYDGHFYFQTGWLPFIFRKVIPGLLVLTGAAFFGLWFLGIIRRKWVWGINTKIMLFVFGSQVLCVGIINSFFKLIWGRARPYEVVEFGGNLQFSPPLVISNQCNWDCSFISGHTVISFWVLSLALLVSCCYRRAAVAAALIFGCLMGLMRIAQGFHFVSDVVFGAVITVSVILWLHYKLFPDDYC